MMLQHPGVPHGTSSGGACPQLDSTAPNHLRKTLEHLLQGWFVNGLSTDERDVTCVCVHANILERGNVCFYGVCYYCKPAEAACADGEMMEGSLTLWLPKWYELTTKRHPYQRTYIEGKRARFSTSQPICCHW